MLLRERLPINDRTGDGPGRAHAVARRRPDPREAGRGPPPGRAGHAERGGGRGRPAVHHLPLGPEAPQPPDDGAGRGHPARSAHRHLQPRHAGQPARGTDGGLEGRRQADLGRPHRHRQLHAAQRPPGAPRRRQRADDRAGRARRDLPARGHHRPLRPRRVPGDRAARRPRRARAGDRGGPRRARRAQPRRLRRRAHPDHDQRRHRDLSEGRRLAHGAARDRGLDPRLGQGQRRRRDPRHRDGWHRGRRRRDLRRPAGAGLRGGHEGPLHEAALRGRRAVRGLPRPPGRPRRGDDRRGPAGRAAARHRQDRDARPPPPQARAR